MGAGESQDDVLADLAKFEKKLACKIKPISDILSFPLFAHHLDEYCDTGICVIADSAHSIHPLAGQGINLGLADASILAEEIEKGFNTGQNIGHIKLHDDYSTVDLPMGMPKEILQHLQKVQVFLSYMEPVYRFLLL